MIFNHSRKVFRCGSFPNCIGPVRKYFLQSAQEYYKNNKFSHCPPVITLADESSIQTLVRSVMQNVSDGEVIFDMCSSTTKLSEALLAAGAKSIRCFTENESSFAALKELQSRYPGQIRSYQVNLMELHRVINDQLEQKEKWKGSGYLNDLKPRPLSDPPAVKIVTTLSPQNEVEFLRSMLDMAIERLAFFAFGRTELYITMSSRECRNVISPIKCPTRAAGVLYRNFFDSKLLCEIPWSHFEPVIRIPKKCTLVDQKKAYLVRMSSKADIAEKLPQSEWPDYCFFIKQAMFKKSNFVVPYLESWFPDCGPRLLERGMPLFKKFSEMTPDELVDLYKEIRSWPEFHESNFRVATSSFTRLDESSVSEASRPNLNRVDSPGEYDKDLNELMLFGDDEFSSSDLAYS